jgi:uracil-DNA glycosylase
MPENSRELLELIVEARKYVSHLRDLGVDVIGQTAEVQGRTSNVQRPTYKVAETLDIGHGTLDIAPGHSLFGDLQPAPDQICPSTESFEDVHADVGDCLRCPLHQKRTNVVHTEGNPKARLMFVGEAPGADEDIQARPFVGRAGQLLTKIIEAIGLKREEVLIGNVNRCRPPGNRPPTLEEVSMCKPFLLREIAIVQPEVIVVLGNTAMKNLLDTKEGITKLRGKFQDYKGIRVMPTYHPAYLLRDPSKKKETWEDLKKVRDYLESTRKN